MARLLIIQSGTVTSDSIDTEYQTHYLQPIKFIIVRCMLQNKQ